MPINNYLAWILVSDHPHAKPYKVVSLKGLSSETLVCSLLYRSSSHLHMPCQTCTLICLMCIAEVAILSCILKHCRETRSVGNTVGTPIQVYSQDNPFFKNFKGQTLRIWQLHIQNIFFFLLFIPFDGNLQNMYTVLWLYFFENPVRAFQWDRRFHLTCLRMSWMLHQPPSFFSLAYEWLIQT